MADTPAYYKPLVHSKKRRAAWHDYHSRCIYMITVSKAPGAPAFGHVTGIENPERAYIRLTSTGQIISEEIAAIPGHNPQLRVLKYVVMPDHFHALVFVTVPTSKSLGAIVQSLKAAATSRIRASLNAPALSVFEEGFHDRIITHRGQLDVVFNYIRENPRRLAVRRARPEFFRRVNELRIGEGTYRAYGNFQLLECPFKEQVVVHPRIRPRNAASTASSGFIQPPTEACSFRRSYPRMSAPSVMRPRNWADVLFCSPMSLSPTALSRAHMTLTFARRGGCSSSAWALRSRSSAGRRAWL